MKRVGQLTGRVVCLLCVLAVAVTPLAAAHANLASSAPAPNERVAIAPDAVVMSFTEPLDPSFSGAKLYSQEGTPLATEAASFPSPSSMRLPLPGHLGDGVYVVSWQALSTADGHTTSGAFPFLVGNASLSGGGLPPGASSAQDSGGPAETAGRYAFVTGAILVTGTAALLAYGWGRQGAPPALSRATRRLALVAVLLTLVGGGVAALAYVTRISQAAGLDAPAWDALWSTRVGITWLARIAFAGAAALALAHLTTRGSRAALALGLGALVAQAMTGHASAAAVPEVGIAVTWAHLAAASAWVGAFPLLAYAALDRVEGTRVAILRFSALAAWMLALVILSGIALTLAVMGNLAALVASGYGKILLAKVAFVAVLAGMGAYNRFVVVPAVESGDPRAISRITRTVSIEALVGAVVLLLAVGLAVSSPPLGASSPSDEAVVLQADARDLNLTLTITPGPLTPGFHHYELRVLDASGNLVNATEVELKFTPLTTDIGPSGTFMDARSPGIFVSDSGNLALPGDWRVQVRVARADAYDAYAGWDVTVHRPA